MAYCRFSSDNWRSDVYVYEGDQGFMCSVAVFRLHFPGEPPPELDPTAPPDQMLAAYRARREALKKAKRERIGGPYDGLTFIVPTRREMVALLRGLREKGYHVPDFAIAALEAEMEEGLS